MKAHRLLIDEPPLCVLPTLAAKIGLNESLVLQQVHYWLGIKQRGGDTAAFKDGRWWVYNSYEEWRKGNFPFWSEITIKRTFLALEKMGLLASEYLAPDVRDRRKWYTIDYDKYDELMSADNGDTPPYQNDTVHRINEIQSTVSNRDDASAQVDTPHGIKKSRCIPTETSPETTHRNPQRDSGGLPPAPPSTNKEPETKRALNVPPDSPGAKLIRPITERLNLK